MKISNIPFEVIDWKDIQPEKHDGETGLAEWRVRHYDDIRVRVVTYSRGYKADHWCAKGHIIYCLEGSMITELKDGRGVEIKKGMSYHVEDENYLHRSYTQTGATLFIVD
jgi:quercetin dioxygenase-like cupin family protein